MTVVVEDSGGESTPGDLCFEVMVSLRLMVVDDEVNAAMWFFGGIGNAMRRCLLLIETHLEQLVASQEHWLVQLRSCS